MRMTSLDQVETGSFAPQEDVSHAPRKIRVVSWNIARGCRLDEIAEFLAGANADLILLQEVDKHARRTAYRNIAELLAEKLRLNYASGIEFHELTQGSRDEPAHHGQATLSRWPLCDSRVLRFSRQSTYWCPRWWIPSLSPFQRRLGGRMVLLSHAKIAATTFAVYNLHLESRGGDDLRRSQLAEVLNETLRHGLDVPVIVAGDFNFDVTKPGNVCVNETGFHNPFADLGMRTAQAHSFGRSNTIDWILTRGPIVPVSPKIDHSVSASDHYPLSLTLELRVAQ
ncbi:MAG: endonuclease/exonuclease/phosphatase family protein [Acidobacteriia bacterium]|nr:endonuclease/exonuclease/phosphatase family protein [Terriglobia bacterium]